MTNSADEVSVRIAPSTAQRLMDWNVLHFTDNGWAIDLDIWKRAESRPSLQGRLTRPIIGIHNRTALEVFDIMCDRIRHARAALDACGCIELDSLGEAMICEGCGTTRTLATVKARHGPQTISCCPERKMRPARWYWERAMRQDGLPPSEQEEG